MTDVPATPIEATPNSVAEATPTASQPSVVPMVDNEANSRAELDAMMNPHYVFVLGSIEARFPNLSLEKEFIQVPSPNDMPKVPTYREQLYHIFKEEQYRYIARDMCWVLIMENVDNYLLYPRTEHELTQLIDSLQKPLNAEISVVIGQRGPIAPPSMCNGLQLPVIVLSHLTEMNLESFSSTIVNAHPLPKEVNKTELKEITQSLFLSLMQFAANLGEGDEQRAIYYLALLQDKNNIYEQAVVQAQQKGSILSQIKVEPSPVHGDDREILEIIFTYVNLKTNVPDRYFARIDVTGMYPFLVSPLQPYYGAGK